MTHRAANRELVVWQIRTASRFFGVAAIGLMLWGALGASAAATERAAGRAAATAAAGEVRPSDSPALQALMSAAFGRDDAVFALTPSSGGGFTAALRGGAMAEIRDGGIVVSAGGHRWGLSAAASGRPGSLAPWRRQAPARAEVNRVEFARRGISAWFVNGPSGLEQGWTISRRPPGKGELRLALTVAGDLRARASADGRSVELGAAAGGEVLRYSGLAAYDARGRQLAARFILRNGELGVGVRDAGATYPVTVDPFVEVAKLAASDGAAQDALGSAVAISSDGSTIVAGAPTATVGAHTQQGAVYVFSRAATGWASGAQTAKLTAADGAAGDQLGHYPHAVGVSADGSTVVAAAPYATVGGHAEPATDERRFSGTLMPSDVAVA